MPPPGRLHALRFSQSHSSRPTEIIVDVTPLSGTDEASKAPLATSDKLRSDKSPGSCPPAAPDPIQPGNPAPPGFRDLCEQLGVEPDRLRDLLAHAERAGRLVRAPGDLWFDREAIDALRRRVVEHLQRHERLDTAAYKALIGTTRRSAVPLMELFDAERVTVRRGEHRLLRQPRERS